MDVFTCGAPEKADAVIERLAKFVSEKFPEAVARTRSADRFPRFDVESYLERWYAKCVAFALAGGHLHHKLHMRARGHVRALYKHSLLPRLYNDYPLVR